MKNLPKHYLPFFLIFITYSLVGQSKTAYSEYHFLRKNYEGLLENDTNALKFIDQYIAKAKKEKNNEQLIQGYLDGILYSASPDQKLKFADSTIYASKLTGDMQKISAAFLEKGVVYYFQFKNYSAALDQYLKAYSYSKDNKDEFYKNRLIYLMGAVNNYIGDYDSAVKHLKLSRTFFESESQKSIHPNLLYNNLRGYFNSMHQLAVCYRNLKKFKIADSLIAEGISKTASSKEYMQEYGYFLKERGIQQFRDGQYTQAINSLSSAIKPISSVNDFAWVTVCYSYLGRSYHSLRNDKMAVTYLKKVDSIFQKHNFILPEIRNDYKLLMDYYKTENDIHKQYFYLSQLNRATSGLYNDFNLLRNKINKEYTPLATLEVNTYLSKEIVRQKWSTLKIAAICLFVLFFLIILHYQKQNQLMKRYKKLEKSLLDKQNYNSIDNNKLDDDLCHDIEQNTIDDILKKLEKFEKNNNFTEGGLTAAKLAEKFDTNVRYLSLIVLQYRGMTFKKYVTLLRISYITEKLYKERKYLAYTLESLAYECGFGSRANFSKKFEEINGVKPSVFIKKRQQDFTFADDSQTDIIL